MKKLLFLFFVGVTVFAQTPDPKKILNEVVAKFAKVKDYQVDAYVKLDIPFVKMPDRKLTIYYKQPNKTHLESESFAMLPKRGLNFNPKEFISDDYMPVYLKQDYVNGRKTDVINLIPKSDSAHVRFIKLWIDPAEKVIVKLETTGDRMGVITSELSYGDQIMYGLPAQMKIQMDFGTVRIPGEIQMGGKQEPQKDSKGKVTVSYYNYKINKGIEDKIFIEKKK